MPLWRRIGAAYYGAVTAVRFAAMLEKEVLMPLPRIGTAAIKATAMRAAIKLYSMAVAPDSSRTNRLRNFFISAGPCLRESLRRTSAVDTGYGDGSLNECTARRFVAKLG